LRDAAQNALHARALGFGELQPLIDEPLRFAMGSDVEPQKTKRPRTLHVVLHGVKDDVQRGAVSAAQVRFDRLGRAGARFRDCAAKCVAARSNDEIGNRNADELFDGHADRKKCFAIGGRDGVLGIDLEIEDRRHVVEAAVAAMEIVQRAKPGRDHALQFFGVLAHRSFEPAPAGDVAKHEPGAPSAVIERDDRQFDGNAIGRV